MGLQRLEFEVYVLITVQGTSIGLVDDSKKGLWVYLKICDEDCDTELGGDTVSFWFRCGVDGYLLPPGKEPVHPVQPETH